MAGRNGERKGIQKQGQTQVQIQTTMQRRAGVEELGTWQDRIALPGLPLRSGDLGHDEEADGDQLLDDGDESDCGETAGEHLFPNAETEDEPESPRQLALADLLGSRPPVVLLRLSLENGELMVRPCARPTSTTRQGLEVVRNLVLRCFVEGRPDLDEDEWEQLLGTGTNPAPLILRLTLLLRLAITGGDKVRLGEQEKATYRPKDIGLEGFANKFVALPDGTPFSLRLLLLDKRGRQRGEDVFDRLPDAIKLLALRRALRSEEQTRVAVSDLEFCGTIQQAIEELLGMEIPRPAEEPVRRQLRDNFKRKRLGNLFPNRDDRQRAYNQRTPAASGPCEDPA